MKDLYLRPEDVYRDCAACREYLTTEPGKPYEDKNGNRIKRTPEMPPPPCEMCETSSVTRLTPGNNKTLYLYLRKKHVGLAPEEAKDPLVRDHMVLIGMIDEIAMERRSTDVLHKGLSMAMVRGVVAGVTHG